MMPFQHREQGYGPHRAIQDHTALIRYGLATVPRFRGISRRLKQAITIWQCGGHPRQAAQPLQQLMSMMQMARIGITVNQRTNGSMWNTVGRFNFNGATPYQVKITAANGSSLSTCHAVKFTWFIPVEKTEHIYVCQIYAWDDQLFPLTTAMLTSLGAKQQNSSLWTYRNNPILTTYYIHLLTGRDEMAAALKEEGSHVIFSGHANYGTNPLTECTTEELRSETVYDFRYVDDDRLLNLSSPTVSLKVDGMIYGQKFPNWRPIYKDGTSAMMPYNFNEGTPAYNYYVTYKLPGDSNAYKIELADGRNLERFSDSGVPAWYSPDGTPPDPCLNPDYFIINPDPDFVRVDFTGNWTYAQTSGYLGEGGYYGYNYQYHSAGTGSNTATFNMFVSVAGRYKVSVSWLPNAANATNATYTIEHADGNSIVVKNQQVADGDMNVLGTYNFNRGTYRITLSDNANGRVQADAMLFEPQDNPGAILQAEFTTNVRSGPAPLAVQFTNRSLAMKGTSARLWNFGDGTTSVDNNPLHLYTAPGVYTVSLQITDGIGKKNTETKESVIVVGATAPLKAAFTAQTRNGAGRTGITFINYSTGNITGYLWDFGDGKTSTEANPVHTYNNIGAYTVTLTVSGPDGNDTETETNYINILKPNVYVDNSLHDKTHFMTGSSRPFGKVILDTSPNKIKKEDLKYKRLFYGACQSANYYLVTLQHGIVFCTNADMYNHTAVPYLRDYLQGYSDEDILVDINLIDPMYERIDFTKKPPSMR